ncbi:recQ-mediated genome instability protein 1-like [Cimex lectularius]|uniref:RecQ-mediated genome instability protein 1 n=1 Tax=Cimex lectularius TaxID=79782 RepID=A0A8I6R818_CIMLE|nr:recQ-mediated genome instability protein 1-like [Cimex lectularius]
MKMSNEVSRVSDFLKRKRILIPPGNQWLNSCVMCFKAQSPAHTQDELDTFVYGQWLLADLKEIGSPVLPARCLNDEKLVLNGNYAVQFNYGVDIGTSFHKQMQKIRKPDSQFNLEVNAEESRKSDIPASRALKIELTDGATTVIAFEDNQLRNIKEILPGEKAILKGPLEFRKGCLMLKENNVTLLGGEVDTLLISNAVENVLARALSLPENPNPYRVHIDTTLKPTLNKVEEESFSKCLDDDDDLFIFGEAIESQLAVSTNTSNVGSKTNSNVQQNITNSNNQTASSRFTNNEKDLLDDDFDFPDDDFEMMASAFSDRKEKNIRNYFPNKNSTVKPTDIDNFINKQNSTHIQSQGTSSSSSIHSSPKITDLNDPKTLKRKLEQAYVSSEENRDWFHPPLKSSLDIPRPSHESGKVIVDFLEGPPDELTLELQPDTQERVSNDCNTNFTFDEPFPPKSYPSERKVRGQVVKLSQKLGIKDEQWSLSAIISVKGLEMEMDFSPQVLDKIFGITGKELTSKRKEVVRNPEIKSQMNKILADSQQRIKSLNSDILVRFNNFISNPVIIQVYDVCSNI